MVGTIDMTISSNGETFHLSFNRKYSIVVGNSGSGKTHFISLLEGNIGGGKFIKVTCPVDFYVVDDYSKLEKIPKNKDCIVFMDEKGVDALFKEDNFARLKKLTEKKRAYYVFVTRRKIEVIPISCSCIYYVDKRYTNGRVSDYYLEQRYVWENESIPSPDVVVVEDSGSGFDFYNQYFDSVVVSAHGNSNLYDVAFDNIKEGIKTIVIIGDSAGLGDHAMDLIDLKVKAIEKFGVKVFLFLPESFEYILLRSRLFYKFITKDVLVSTQDYAESSKFLSWERFYTKVVIELAKNYGSIGSYSKSALTPFYLNKTNLKYIADAADEVLEKGW